MITFATPVTPIAKPTPFKKRDYISYSAISTYQQCPLKYYFKYIEGLPDEVVTASLILGGAIHSAVEHHFNELMIGNLPPDQDSLLAAFWAEWNQRANSQAVQFGKREDLDSIASLADRMLAEFQLSEFAKPQGRIIGIEEQLRGELVPGVPELLARIDLITESEECVTITDLKTARSRWNASQAEQSGQQLLLYSELVKELVPHKPLKLEFAVITKSTKPTVESWPVTLTRSQVDRQKKIIQQVWTAIESETFYPAPGPMSCSTCPYWKPCRQWGAGPTTSSSQESL